MEAEHARGGAGDEGAMADVTTVETEVIGHEDTARLYLAVGRLSRLLRRIGASSSELGHGAVSALFTLVRHRSMRLGDLAAKEGVAPPTLSRIVSSLVDGGYVRRTPDPNDGRAFLVTATEEGERVASGLYSTRLRELQRRLDRMPADQVKLLVAALPALENLVAEDEPTD
jgi:DNA-binding MarR family transcriptional regulator